MSISVRVVVKDDYVCLHCRGFCTLAEAENVYTQVVDVALEHQRSHVLVDVNEVTGELSTMERFKSTEFLVQEVRQRGRGMIRKIAVFGQEPLLDPHRFGETVALNRGLNVKVTTDLHEAIEWLRQ